MLGYIKIYQWRNYFMAICRLACANFIYCVLDWRKELPARLSHAVYFSGCRFVFYNEHSHANMKSASSFSFFFMQGKYMAMGTN